MFPKNLVIKNFDYIRSSKSYKSRFAQRFPREWEKLREIDKYLPSFYKKTCLNCCCHHLLFLVSYGETIASCASLSSSNRFPHRRVPIVCHLQSGLVKFQFGELSIGRSRSFASLVRAQVMTLCQSISGMNSECVSTDQIIQDDSGLNFLVVRPIS